MNRNHCSVCGQFVKRSADFSIPFGRSNDLEDEEFYCDYHAENYYNYYVGQGWVPNSRVKADWQRRAAKTLGLEEYAEGSTSLVWRKPVLPLPAHAEA